MAVPHKKREIRYTKSAISQKVKRGGRRVVSQALVKIRAADLTPRVHVKRGDTVILITGPNKSGKYDPDLKKRLDERNAYKGQIGKVLSVDPASGKIKVEGINMITRATKQRGLQQAGRVRKEGALFACRVMLYCNSCEKPTRIKHKVEASKKTRVCRRCNEAFDT